MLFIDPHCSAEIDVYLSETPAVTENMIRYIKFRIVYVHEDRTLKQCSPVIPETDKMFLSAQEVHHVDVLETEDNIMHDRVADKNKHVDDRGQREKQADVVVPEERFDPVQNDSPLP